MAAARSKTKFMKPKSRSVCPMVPIGEDIVFTT